MLSLLKGLCVIVLLFWIFVFLSICLDVCLLVLFTSFAFELVYYLEELVHSVVLETEAFMFLHHFLELLWVVVFVNYLLV